MVARKVGFRIWSQCPFVGSRSLLNLTSDLFQRTSVLIEPSQGEQTRTVTISASKPPEYDVVIVGAGIVGLATARELIQAYPKLKFAVLEKEDHVAAHQSGHNSGVIHCGIYYTPGSLKAKLCVEGLDLTYKYCDKWRIPYKKCGKLIVAVDDKEVNRLKGLYERGLRNNVQGLQLIGPKEIKAREPHCTGLKAIWCPNTGIVDWEQVTKSFARNFQELGGKIHLNFEVANLRFANTLTHKSDGGEKYPVVISGPKGVVKCKHLLTCGGLQSDRIAQMSGCSPEPRIVPFRGEYLILKPERRYLVRGNIYPVPNPDFPFLGVHFTPRMNGEVWLGPNAVLAFKREGYKFFDFSTEDFFDTLKFRGFQKLMLSYFTFGMGEFSRSFFISQQVKRLQKYIPEIKLRDVARSGPTGVRAQAMTMDGKLVDDFIFDSGDGELGKRTLHVRNAPSPAATSSLAIAKMVAKEAKQRFKFA